MFLITGSNFYQIFSCQRIFRDLQGESSADIISFIEIKSGCGSVYSQIIDDDSDSYIFHIEIPFVGNQYTQEERFSTHYIFARELYSTQFKHTRELGKEAASIVKVGLGTIIDGRRISAAEDYFIVTVADSVSISIDTRRNFILIADTVAININTARNFILIADTVDINVNTARNFILITNAVAINISTARNFI